MGLNVQWRGKDLTPGVDLLVTFARFANVGVKLSCLPCYVDDTYPFRKLHPHSIEEGLRRNPGVVATAMHCVNAVPYVCAAAPGLLTYLEMPLVAGRAATHLHRSVRQP